MATASKIVIAEVEEILPEGEFLDPSFIHTPGLFVDYLVQSEELPEDKPIEFLFLDDGVRYFKQSNKRNALFNGSTLMTPLSEEEIAEYQHQKEMNSDSNSEKMSEGVKKRHKIAKACAKLVPDDCKFLNLGIGIPTLVPSYLSSDLQKNISLHSENGILGMDRFPEAGEEEPDLVNAGKESVQVSKSASFFCSSDSFGIVRGGHLDMTILGAMQVSQSGDVSNWMAEKSYIPEDLDSYFHRMDSSIENGTFTSTFKGIGGAMDLVACDETDLVICMTHTSKSGESKIVEKCDFPLTGVQCVDKIVTELAVFEVEKLAKSRARSLKLIGKSRDASIEEIKEKTACNFNIASKLFEF